MGFPTRGGCSNQSHPTYYYCLIARWLIDKRVASCRLPTLSKWMGSVSTTCALVQSLSTLIGGKDIIIRPSFDLMPFLEGSSCDVQGLRWQSPPEGLRRPNEIHWVTNSSYVRGQYVLWSMYSCTYPPHHFSAHWYDYYIRNAETWTKMWMTTPSA